MAGAGCGAPKPGSVTIDGVGIWSFKRLGYDDDIFTPKGFSVPSIAYRLPPHVRERPGSWHLVHLHLRVRFSASTRPGDVYFGAATNGYATALVKFTVVRNSRSGFEVVWSDEGIVDGYVRQRTRSRVIELWFSNYLQLRGVQPGLNGLTFFVAQPGSARVAELRVLANSSLELSTRSPARVRITTPVRLRRVAVGDRFKVPFAVVNEGDRLAWKLVVSAQYPPGALDPIGSSTRQLSPLPSGQSRRGELLFRPVHPGRYSIVLFVSSNSNRPGTMLEVDVAPIGTSP